MKELIFYFISTVFFFGILSCGSPKAKVTSLAVDPSRARCIATDSKTNLYCDSGTWRPLLPGECVLDSDCSRGSSCVSNKCSNTPASTYVPVSNLWFATDPIQPGVARGYNTSSIGDWAARKLNSQEFAQGVRLGTFSLSSYWDRESVFKKSTDYRYNIMARGYESINDFCMSQAQKSSNLSVRSVRKWVGLVASDSGHQEQIKNLWQGKVYAGQVAGVGETTKSFNSLQQITDSSGSKIAIGPSSAISSASSTPVELPAGSYWTGLYWGGPKGNGITIGQVAECNSNVKECTLTTDCPVDNYNNYCNVSYGYVDNYKKCGSYFNSIDGDESHCNPCNLEAAYGNPGSSSTKIDQSNPSGYALSFAQSPGNSAAVISGKIGNICGFTSGDPWSDYTGQTDYGIATILGKTLADCLSGDNVYAIPMYTFYGARRKIAGGSWICATSDYVSKIGGVGGGTNVGPGHWERLDSSGATTTNRIICLAQDHLP